MTVSDSGYPPRGAGAEESRSTEAASGLPILIVDDSETLRRQLQELIGEIPGVRVVGEAANGTEALTLMVEMEPTLVILDLALPDCSGLDVLARTEDLGIEPTVLMLTNHGDPTTRRTALANGASHFFDKSTEFESMLDTVRALSSEWAASEGPHSGVDDSDRRGIV